jgi:Leucine-rich repeat (LRR) protein
MYHFNLPLTRMKILAFFTALLLTTVSLAQKGEQILSNFKDLETRTDLSKVTWAALHNANLTSFPEGLFKCKNLEYITITGSKLASIPDEIATAFPKLYRIEFEDCGLTEIPEAIYRIPKLRILSLDKNKITIVTDRINSLTNLETLSIGENGIQALPMINLPKLKNLMIGKNSLTALPESVFTMKSLELIHAHNNPIAVIPDNVGSLSRLEILSLSDTKIESLPLTLQNCKKLKEIGIIDTPLSKNAAERARFESSTGKKLVIHYRM